MATLDGATLADRLGALVGRWRTDGRVLIGEPLAVTGTDTYEWPPGRTAWSTTSTSASATGPCGRSS